MRLSLSLPTLTLLASACFESTFTGPPMPDAAMEAETGDDMSSEEDRSPAPEPRVDGHVPDGDVPDAEQSPREDDSGVLPDGGPLDGDAGDAAAELPPLHASCQSRAPAVLPSEIVFAEDSEDTYGSWRSLPCDDLEVEMYSDPFNACDDTSACFYDADGCAQFASGGPGLCIPTWEDGPGEMPWLVNDHGTCGVALPAAAKRAACCLGLVDCQAAPKGPGGDCLHHTDCQPGLVCVGQPEWFYGICACPGVQPSALSFNQCAKAWEPLKWGASPPSLGEGACQPGASPGWVEEVVASGRFESLAATEFQGEIYVLTSVPSFMDGTFLHTRNLDGAWAHTMLDERQASGVAIHAGADGALHVAACMKNQLFADIDAFSAPLIDDGCVTLNQALDESGEPVIVYNAFGTTTAKLTRHASGGWLGPVTVGTAGQNQFAPTVGIDGDHDVHVWYGGGHHAVVRTGVTLHSNEEALPSAYEAHLTEGGGELLVAYTDTFDLMQTLRVLPVNDPDALPEEAWVQDQAGFQEEPLEPRIVYAPDGEPAIAHRTPAGITLSKRSAGQWSSERVVAVASQPERNLRLLFDSSGEPHIFYSVDTNFTLDQELRHAYRGTCPAR